MLLIGLLVTTGSNRRSLAQSKGHIAYSYTRNLLSTTPAFWSHQRRFHQSALATSPRTNTCTSPY